MGSVCGSSTKMCQYCPSDRAPSVLVTVTTVVYHVSCFHPYFFHQTRFSSSFLSFPASLKPSYHPSLCDNMQYIFHLLIVTTSVRHRNVMYQMSGETEDIQSGRQRDSVGERGESGTGRHGEETEAPLCSHCHGYCRNDSADSRAK